MPTVSPYFDPSSQTGGSTPNLQTKTITLNQYGTVVIAPDSGYDGLQQVNVNVQTRLKSVGGRIFYIDNSSTTTYKFYDSSMNEISSVSVGDTPAFYEELTSGNGKDKFYVYHDELYTTKYWTYKVNDSWVYESLGVTNDALGAGKTNTATVMAANNGAYITDEASGEANSLTIWKIVQNARDSLIGGCDDWFIGSKDEYTYLANFLAARSGTLTNYFATNDPWSSTEKNDQNSYNFLHASSSWDYNKKHYQKDAVLIRAF